MQEPAATVGNMQSYKQEKPGSQMLGIIGILALGGIAGIKMMLTSQDEPLPSINPAP
jgi:hypothetical protein